MKNGPHRGSDRQVINMCIPIENNFLQPIEERTFKVCFCRRLAQGGKMEITTIQGFKRKEKVWWGESREAAAAKNGCWRSSDYCGCIVGY